MASSQRFIFTDEEMLEELRRLGYTEVPPEVFQMMKDDIAKLAEALESNSPFLETSPNLNTSSNSTSLPRIPARNDNHKISHKMAKNVTIDDQKFNYDDVSEPRMSKGNRFLNRDNLNEDVQTTFSNDSSGTSDEFVSVENGNDTAYNAVQQKGETENNGKLFPKTIKRKVMRHRNGQAVITEQFLPLSSTPESLCEASNGNVQSNESLSSGEFSFQSSGSSGSLSRPVSNNFPSNRSTSSLSSTRSAPPRISIPRRKKSDPVAMYNYYRKFWDNFKPPGEKTHDKLRWTVRDKMLDYH